MEKNIKKIKQILDKKYDKLNTIKRTYNKTEENETKQNLKRDFEFINNSLLDEINKVYQEYIERPFSFDNEVVRTRWIMNQEDYGKFFAFSIKNKEIKSRKLFEKKGVLMAHKKQLEEESVSIQQKLEEEVRKNDFFQNPNAQCKEGIVSKISKIYLSISKLDEDNFREIMVDPQFKTILEDETVKPGQYCILKDSNNPTISPEQIDMNDRIFERILGDDKRPSWKEKSSGFIADYIREYKKICQDKGPECKFTNSFGPCEPEVIKRLKQNKKENLEKKEIIIQRILEIEEKRKETQIEESLKYYKGRELLNKQDLINKKNHSQLKMIKFRKSVNLSLDMEQKDYEDLQKRTKDLSNPEKREQLILLLKSKYDIDFLELDDSSGHIEETELGNFNDAGQRITHHEAIDGSIDEEVTMTDNEILDTVRSYLVSSTKEEGLNLDDDLDTVQNIIQVFLQIFGITINTKTIEFKVLSIFKKSFLSFKEFKKQSKKKLDLESKYNKLKKKNLIYYTSSILFVELQIRLNNYFMSYYEKCISSIDGYPIIPKEDETSSGDRFNYGINFIICILNNLKKGGGFWESIKDDKKIKSNFKEVLESILKEKDFQNRLHKKREKLEKHKKMIEDIEQNYSWNEFRPFLNKLEQLDEPPVLDLNDCRLEKKSELVKALKLADDRSKWYSAKIFEKINSIIQQENIENIKYDPLPIGNSCCLDFINRDYNYYKFLYDKDSSNELKEFIEQSKELENKCKSSNFKLYYIKPTIVRPTLETFANNIFPKKKEVSKNIISQVSSNYIINGNNIGKKRIFKNYFIKPGENPIEIDIMTNENLQEIPKDKTEDEFFSIISSIHNRNKIDEPELPELETDMSKFKLNSIIKSFKECFDGSVFMENTFINKLVNEYSQTILEGSLKDVKSIWDKLSVNLNLIKKEMLTYFSNTKIKKEMEIIIDNLNNFDLSDKVDGNVIDDKDTLNLEIYKRKEKNIHKYFTNYLKKYVSLLANTKIKQLIAESEFDNYKYLDKFVKSKYRKIFKQIREFTKTLSKFRILTGIDDIKDCNDNIIESSKFGFKNCLELLELSFLLALQFIINMDSDEKSDNENTDDENSDSSEGLFTDNRMVRINFVQELLTQIDLDRKKKDKYNAKNNITEINKLNESNKDRNLYVMQLLDLETRRLRNEQTKAGLVKYADLSKDFSDVLDRDESEQRVRSELGADATDEQVSEELKQREIEAYGLTQTETFNTPEGDDED